uniref:Uncharacterized protein n=1 Tax=Physcomitrium patens TaxID=3218 RepID=A0A2K1J6T1_PHYPA|nr:hypothetical protein PHYPA_020338 [Physcomitrium patens]
MLPINPLRPFNPFPPTTPPIPRRLWFPRAERPRCSPPRQYLRYLRCFPSDCLCCCCCESPLRGCCSLIRLCCARCSCRLPVPASAPAPTRSAPSFLPEIPSGSRSARSPGFLPHRPHQHVHPLAGSCCSRCCSAAGSTSSLAAGCALHSTAPRDGCPALSVAAAVPRHRPLLLLSAAMKPRLVSTSSLPRPTATEMNSEMTTVSSSETPAASPHPLLLYPPTPAAAAAAHVSCCFPAGSAPCSARFLRLPPIAVCRAEMSAAPLAGSTGRTRSDCPSPPALKSLPLTRPPPGSPVDSPPRTAVVSCSGLSCSSLLEGSAGPDPLAAVTPLVSAAAAAAAADPSVSTVAAVAVLAVSVAPALAAAVVPAVILVAHSEACFDCSRHFVEGTCVNSLQVKPRRQPRPQISTMPPLTLPKPHYNPLHLRCYATHNYPPPHVKPPNRFPNTPPNPLHYHLHTPSPYRWARSCCRDCNLSGLSCCSPPPKSAHHHRAHASALVTTH